MDFGLNGKVALVTGASRGIGRAAALALGAEGARVAIAARNASELESSAARIRSETGADVCAVRADVSKAEDIAALVMRVEKEFGPIGILVPNAGGPRLGTLEETSERDWQEAYELTVLSVVRLTRAVLPGMRARQWGRIIAVESSSVKQPIEGLVLSNSLRPGVAGFIKTVAIEEARHGILANTVCLGRIMTERFLSGVERSGLDREEYIARASRDVPLGRIGKPEEVGNVVAFLASERASYVTGCAISVDGGLWRGL